MATDGLRGLIVVDASGEVICALGSGTDAGLQALARDPAWLQRVRRRRLMPLPSQDARLMALATAIDEGTLLVFSEVADETVLQFFLSVDFAYDILHHILADPFEALNVVDAAGKVAWLSPTHEQYLGLEPGGSVGRAVRDVIPNTRLHQVVRTGVAEVGRLQRFKGYERVVSRHPIRHDGEIVGAIGRIMFKGPEQVEMLSQRINALEREIESYRRESEAQRKGDEVLEAIVGDSFAIRAVKEQIRKIAPLDIPVLVQGDSGTGKELVAQALHRLSPRHAGPLVTVNAAALPASLVESELFGYEAGSFTGADRKGRKGKFEQADGGTIFLD
ncbi:MAG: sigma 54-interacting transcriptional regulator, partial [Gammaproteobacteria bacterium]|nr:sigma 54-interacting transcriptional regulator [Gammaproteobacteria bacterium]